MNIQHIETHLVPTNINPLRLQEYGVGIFNSALTKSALKKALKKRYITVDGNIATTATLIKGGETIQLNIPPEASTKKQLLFPLEVLFEDDYLAVIHKPAGILVSGNSFKTIANALPQNLTPSPQPDATLPQPIHRLDYATTGILLVGKTSSSIRELSQLFKLKTIQKTYYAVAIGQMETKGVITTEVDEKRCESIYSLIESVPSPRFGNLSLIQLNPLTGRRHQLRKHLSGIGHPILGDKDYGIEPLILNGKGLYLHAYSLTFTHPFTHEPLTFVDPLPERFTKLFPQIEKLLNT